MEIIMLTDYWYKKKLYRIGEVYNVHPIIGIELCNEGVAEEFNVFESDIEEFI
jgi:hypothetical protein